MEEVTERNPTSCPLSLPHCSNRTLLGTLLLLRTHVGYHCSIPVVSFLSPHPATLVSNQTEHQLQIAYSSVKYKDSCLCSSKFTITKYSSLWGRFFQRQRLRYPAPIGTFETFLLSQFFPGIRTSKSSSTRPSATSECTKEPMSKRSCWKTQGLPLWGTLEAKSHQPRNLQPPEQIVLENLCCGDLYKVKSVCARPPVTWK